MVILRKLALRVQANLGAHSGKIKNAASLLEASFEPFNFHWDMSVLHRDSSSVRAPAGASGGTAFKVRSLRQPFEDGAAQRFHQTGPQSSGIGSECPVLPCATNQRLQPTRFAPRGMSVDSAPFRTTQKGLSQRLHVRDVARTFFMISTHATLSEAIAAAVSSAPSVCNFP